MKNKFFVKAVLLFVSALSFVGLVSGTIAWFNSRVTVDNSQETNNIDGEAIGAYFAYGNGIPHSVDGDGNRVYGITKPRHLYNLAWLQYLGYFDQQDPSKPNYGQQFYFELANDIDMDGWVLPPIGTEEHPFIGNFTGNGYVISNLSISSNFNDYNTHPSAINSSNYVTPHILGMFGVIGNYNSTYNTSATNSVYSSSVNEFKNTGLTDVTITSKVSDSLVGLAAGYVDGIISNVAIDSGEIDINKDAIGGTATSSYGGFTSNISDHGLVGYTTKKTSIKKITDTIYDIDVQSGQEFNANAQGNNQGWGGSIDMMSMFQRLDNIRQRASTTTSTYRYRTITNHNADGTTNTTPSNYTGGKIFTPTGNTASMGNFNLMAPNANYMYLGGGERVIDNYYEYYEHVGRYITDGTNYLTFDGTNLSNSTSTTNATAWKFEVYNGSVYYISTEYDGTTYYLYYNGGALAIATNPTAANRRWTVTQNSNDNMTISFNTSKIYYYEGEWTLIPTADQTEPDYYYIQSGSNYISSASTSGATPTNVTNVNNAAHFYIEEGTNYFYFLNGNRKMYLAYYYRNNNNQALRIINSTGTNYYYYFTFDGTTLSATRNNNTYYVRYNNGWTYTTNTGQRVNPTVGGYKTIYYSTFYLNNTLANAEITQTGPDNYMDNAVKVNSYTASNTTYFPLNVVSDGGSTNTKITNGDYCPTDANTGYVISGSTMSDDATYSNGGPAKVRVSSYAKNSGQTHQYTYNTFKYSGTNYQNGTIADADVRTITSAGDVSLTTAYSDPEKDLEKYSSSKATLLTVLRSSANNYGLHFMDSQISTNDILEAQNISILGQSYGNPNDSNPNLRTYEMPVNAIDFNLKERGYINFFAGAYFSSDVTSFFSMHQIFRGGIEEGYDIEEIKEIAEIYGNVDHKNLSYAYKFTDGTYSKPYKFNGSNEKWEMNVEDITVVEPNYVESHNLSSSEFATYTSSTYGYTKLFDTEWITNFTHSGHTKIYNLLQYYIYYFEIPMNGGEYCLGSVSGGVGGYLLYLDIGASAAKTERTMVAEHFMKDEFTFNYPDGVALIPTSTADGTGFNAENSVCVSIMATYKGIMDVSRDDANHVTVDRDSSYTSVAKPSYISDTIVSVVDPGGTSIVSSLAYVSRVETETYRIQYLDYNVNYESTTKIVFTDTRTRTNDGSWGSFTRVVTQQVDNGDITTLTSDTQITNGSFALFKYFGPNNSNNGTTWSYTDAMNTSSTIYYNGTSAVSASTICSTLDDELIELYHILAGTQTDSLQFVLEMVVDEENTDGTYYIYKDYIVLPTLSEEGTVTYVVKTIGGKTICFITESTVMAADGTYDATNP